VQEQNGQVRALPKAQVNHENNALVFSSAFDSGADKAVRMWTLDQSTPNNNPQQIGVHNAPVKKVAFLQSSNLVVSGG